LFKQLLNNLFFNFHLNCFKNDTINQLPAFRPPPPDYLKQKPKEFLFCLFLITLLTHNVTLFAQKPTETKPTTFTFSSCEDSKDTGIPMDCLTIPVENLTNNISKGEDFFIVVLFQDPDRVLINGGENIIFNRGPYKITFTGTPDFTFTNPDNGSETQETLVYDVQDLPSLLSYSDLYVVKRFKVKVSTTWNGQFSQIALKIQDKNIDPTVLDQTCYKNLYFKERTFCPSAISAISPTTTYNLTGHDSDYDYDLVCTPQATSFSDQLISEEITREILFDVSDIDPDYKSELETTFGTTINTIQDFINLYDKLNPITFGTFRVGLTNMFTDTYKSSAYPLKKTKFNNSNVITLTQKFTCGGLSNTPLLTHKIQLSYTPEEKVHFTITKL
jgi:hypothetical protein